MASSSSSSKESGEMPFQIEKIQDWPRWVRKLLMFLSQKREFAEGGRYAFSDVTARDYARFVLKCHPLTMEEFLATLTESETTKLREAARNLRVGDSDAGEIDGGTIEILPRRTVKSLEQRLLKMNELQLKKQDNFEKSCSLALSCIQTFVSEVIIAGKLEIMGTNDPREFVIQLKQLLVDSVDLEGELQLFNDSSEKLVQGDSSVQQYQLKWIQMEEVRECLTRALAEKNQVQFQFQPRGVAKFVQGLVSVKIKEELFKDRPKSVELAVARVLQLQNAEIAAGVVQAQSGHKSKGGNTGGEPPMERIAAVVKKTMDKTIKSWAKTSPGGGGSSSSSQKPQRGGAKGKTGKRVPNGSGQKRQQQDRVSDHDGEKKRIRGACFNCGKSDGHVARHCPLPTKCLLCKKDGHLKAECPEKKG